MGLPDEDPSDGLEFAAKTKYIIIFLFQDLNLTWIRKNFRQQSE